MTAPRNHKGSALLPGDVLAPAAEQLRVGTVPRGVTQVRQGAVDEAGQVALQAALQVARVERDTHDAVCGMAAVILGGVEQVARLGLAIVGLDGVVLGARVLVQGDAPVRGEEVVGQRGRPDDADRVLGRRLGRRLEDRCQELAKQERAEAVGGQLHLVALGAGHVGGREHDARIVDEHVEALLLREERVDGRLDGAQVGEVQGQEREAALGGGMLGLSVGDGRLSLVAAASGHIDGSVLLIEDLHELLADPRVCAGDNVHLARLVG